MYSLLVASRGVQDSGTDGGCSDVLQAESADGLPAGRFQWEAGQSAEAGSSGTRTLHGKSTVLKIQGFSLQIEFQTASQ